MKNIFITILFLLLSSLSYANKNIAESLVGIPLTKNSSYENKIIKEVKKDVINDISYLNISKEKKIYLKKKISTIESFNNPDLGPIMAFYFNVTVDKKNYDYIILNSSKSNNFNYKYTVYHEFMHYVDNLLGYELLRYGNQPYSAINQINNIVLDNDLLDTNYIGFDSIVFSRLEKFYFNGINLKLQDTIININHFKSYMNSSYEAIKYSHSYLTSTTEVYARFHGLKKYLLDQGKIKKISDDITQEHLNYILSMGLFNLVMNEHLDFTELFLFMDIEIYNITDNYYIVICNNLNEINKII